MFRWMPYAFVRIVVFFLAGIIAGIYQPDLLKALTAHLLFACCTVSYLLLAFSYQKFQVNPGMVGMWAILLAGFINAQLRTESRRSDHIVHLDVPINQYKAIIHSSPEEKSRSWKYEARIVDVKTDCGWNAHQGKILLYTSKKDVPELFRYGDIVLINGTPKAIPSPANPGEFDYKKFLSFRGIYHQQYVTTENIVLLGNDPPNMAINYALSIRTWAEGTLKEFIASEREQALVSALVLGVKDGLDQELLNAYAATGSMHVLAVSGLHVGIVYWIILLLSKPFQQMRSAKWILLAFSLCILWSYAFVTGLSPSVLRAVTMFSFVAAARPLSRKTNIYNTLAASAFCLLLYDPFLIMSLGFQLSYLAVLGIVSFQPALYRLWEPRHRVLDEIWRVSSVSIAAQLATFALGLLYFHQFPNYFLLSNLFVIPGAFIVLLMGLGLMAVSPINPLAEVIGWALKWIVKALNGVVFSIEKIPYSVQENVYITSFQCTLLLLAIATFYFWTEKKIYRLLIASSVLFFTFSVLQWTHYAKDVRVQKLTVYKIPGHTAVDFISNGKTYFLSDSLLQTDTQKTKFHILPNRLMHGVKRIYWGDVFRKEIKGGGLVVWGKKVILHIRDEGFVYPDKVEVDVVIISNNSVKNLDVLLGKIKFKKIVIDSSNTFYIANRLVSQANKLNVNVFSVLHEGAFEMGLNENVLQDT